MNLLGIDYGTKRIGLAVAVSGIIETMGSIPSDSNTFTKICEIVKSYRIGKIYVGISQGPVALQTKNFVKKLGSVLQLPIETVEEAVSTIEAEEIFKRNKGKRKEYGKNIDSIAAAVILRRVLS